MKSLPIEPRPADPAIGRRLRALRERRRILHHPFLQHRPFLRRLQLLSEDDIVDLAEREAPQHGNGPDEVIAFVDEAVAGFRGEVGSRAVGELPCGAGSGILVRRGVVCAGGLAGGFTAA